jgi:chemotaxis protein methyltransferase CheR
MRSRVATQDIADDGLPVGIAGPHVHAHARHRGGEGGLERAFERTFEYNDHDFRRVARLIRERAGIHLGLHKRDMVYSRLARRIRALGLHRFGDYLDLLETGAGPEDEAQCFVNALTTNLTSFFRESHHFEALAGHLRAIAAGAPSGSVQRLWCCAASTGEEAYSLAITACETFDTLAPPVRILATDIDTSVLETARLGVYPLERVEALSLPRRKRFFDRGVGPYDGMCRVKPAVQALVEFRPLNLLAGDYGLRAGFCAVFCRNVMIYFDKPTQHAVLRRIMPLLADRGLLFAGHSENFSHAGDVVTVCGRTTYHAATAQEQA